jgi:predicted N-formylglutamate amidohydrolase
VPSPEILLTCEHGGNRIPARYRRFFGAAGAALAGHEGADLGALQVARLLAARLDAPLIGSTVSRLLVDLNRSVGHPRLFSRFSAQLPAEAQGEVIDRYYLPHRNAVEDWIGERIDRDTRVVHVGVHSFAPRLRGRVRNADVGLLYDPARRLESALCREWAGAIAGDPTALRVRRNYPYRGVSDGLTTALRRRFRAGSYLGIELELNQARLALQGRRLRLLSDLIARALETAIAAVPRLSSRS